MNRLLEHIDFRDRGRALDNLRRISSDIPPGLQPRIDHLLAASADPDDALHYLERLHVQQPGAFQKLIRSASGLQYLIAVFSYSSFLSEEVLQHPEWLEELPASGAMHRVLSAEEYVARLEAFLGDADGPPKALSLAMFRRQQILRILIRDVLPLCTLPETTEELSNLADAILDVSYRRIRDDLIRRYGSPGAGRGLCGFSVLALGKLGGKELNYSSDIDLMFVYGGSGETNGPNSITNKEFYKKVANLYTELLSTYTPEGFCYRVDLRLRPDGRLGEIAISVDGAEDYYKTRARDWELQMLIKARVAAGEREPGRRLLDVVEPMTYSTTLDFTAVESVSLTRERISEKLAAKRGGQESDVKLARGGIRDIEFLVQCLQRLHGGREPWVRHGGTLLALSRLRDKDLLSPAEYGKLASAYEFLRNLEHRLQFDEDRQTHTLPAAPEDMELLARRMPAAEIGGEASGDRLLRRLNQHLEEVQELYERVIHAQRPMYYGVVAAAEEQPVQIEAVPSNVVRFLDQRAPHLGGVLARRPVRRGARHFEAFLEKIVAEGEPLKWLDADPVLAGFVLDLFEHSVYFAEQLVRTPQHLGELRKLRTGGEAGSDGVGLLPAETDPAELRREFRREMLRIQAESICLRVPIFTTLKQTSALADAVISAAYRMAVEQTAVSRPARTAGYKPESQLMVIALGRLGMLEFDLASDADLIFVLRDQDTHEQVFWTHVAERMINLITAYTGDGVMFAVDTRLRPNGREGALVQTETGYKDYFARQAEAWEGITYMKSRAVAGDTDRATAFLSDLQTLDWRRYGQSARSKKALRQMRMRLEKEQGGENPLKAAFGGYYDIDFALMYLRLKAAGIFFKVLNTPERIDVIEKMGHLERADAEFLADAATFYRAVDHAMRVYSGHTEGSLPNSQAQLEPIADLVARWTPEHLTDQPLKVELAQIQHRTREYFNRLFEA